MECRRSLRRREGVNELIFEADRRVALVRLRPVLFAATPIKPLICLRLGISPWRLSVSLHPIGQRIAFSSEDWSDALPSASLLYGCNQH